MFSMPQSKPILKPSNFSPPDGGLLGFTRLQGRMSEFSGEHDQSRLSLAFTLVLDAQKNAEPVAWLTREESAFFPPDAQAHGIDLNALVVIRLPSSQAMARAADKLTRSGAFGLIILDLDQDQHLPRPIISRLNHLCRKHCTAITCLTKKSETHPSLSALISLRAVTHRTRQSPFYYTCSAHITKDKQYGPGQHAEFTYSSPPGLP